MSRTKTLNSAEAIEFINSVVEQSFRTDENGEIDYIPYLKDTAIRLYTIKMYGGIEYDEAEDIMLFAYGDTYDDIYPLVNRKQWEQLVKAIDERIEWVKAKILSADMRSIAESAAVIAKKDVPLSGIDKALTEFAQELGGKFKDVDWKELAEDVKSARLDPAEFAKVLVDKKYPAGE